MQFTPDEPVDVLDVSGLVCFLYVLLRDRLPAGEVEKILAEHVEPAADTGAQFSNRHLEAYARELAGRLVKQRRAPLTVCAETPEGGESMSEVKLADLKRPEAEVTHYLKHGETPCPMSLEHGAPVTWPRGHVWSQRWKDVTCEECLKAKPEGEGA